MKRISRVLGLFLCFALALSVNVFAGAQPTIDVSNASQGYFTTYYEAKSDLKMKVGVTYQGDTTYFDYEPNTVACYTFSQGDGRYTVTLYRNLSGTTYKKVASKKVTVKLENDLLPYLISTTEITFAEDDAVGQKAAELCEGLETDADKIVAIHNYIAKNFRYDYIFAYAVKSGSVKSYMPNTTEALNAQKGVCIDFSVLFAAMCRSQGIPCAVAKGYISSGYHAWNMVWLDGEWIPVDLTNAIVYRLCHAEVLADCSVSLDGYRDYTF